MRVLITGGGGVLGQMLVHALQARGTLGLAHGAAPALREIVVFDQMFPPGATALAGVTAVRADVSDGVALARVFADGIDALFHLAAVVSAGAEADFDLGMQVNVDGLRCVLDACRASGASPRVVFASSVAVFGGALPKVVTDATAATPQSSYGTQKVIGELLLADMTRKGYIDARSVRLPTIVVRPGKPNRAASGFMSSILREPLNGEDARCPVAPHTRMWIMSPELAIDALLHAMELPAERWGWNRTLNLPGLSVSVAEALEALGRIAGPEVLARVRFESDPAIEQIVSSWPSAFRTERAEQLGFQTDSHIDEIVHAHLRSLKR